MYSRCFRWVAVTAADGTGPLGTVGCTRHHRQGIRLLQDQRRLHDLGDPRPPCPHRLQQVRYCTVRHGMVRYDTVLPYALASLLLWVVEGLVGGGYADSHRPGNLALNHSYPGRSAPRHLLALGFFPPYPSNSCCFDASLGAAAASR